jgi:2'-5' RNA ligase
VTGERTPVTTIGVAVDIPEPWGSLLTDRRLAAGDLVAEYIRAHVTLLTPTEIPTADLPAVADRLGAVAASYAPFPLHLRGTGTFRPVTQVVFVAVAAGIGECEELHEAVLEALKELPIEPATRFPYHPHVTVGQNVDADALDAVYADLAGFEAGFHVDAFTLFEHDDGGRWKAYREYSLTGITSRAGGDTRR